MQQSIFQSRESLDLGAGNPQFSNEKNSQDPGIVIPGTDYWVIYLIL